MRARPDFWLSRLGAGRPGLKHLLGLLAAGAVLSFGAGDLTAAPPAVKPDKEGYFFVGGQWAADGDK